MESEMSLFESDFFAKSHLTDSGNLLKAKNNEIKIGDEDYPNPLEGKPHSKVIPIIKEFFRKSKKERDGLTLWSHIIGRTTQFMKPEPYAESIKYVDVSEHPIQNCGNCNFIYFHLASKNHICSIIKRQIFPEGWCKKWKQGKKEYEFTRTKIKGE